VTMTLDQLERTLAQPTPPPIPGQTAVEVDRPGIPRGLAAQFALRTREVAGGHREWIAPTNGRAGRFRHQGRDYTMYRAAFILRTGREPEGPVKPSCDHPGCCAPAHVDDGATRQRDRAALAVIKGTEHRSWSCDHDPDQFARHRADGRRYCAECNRLASKPPKTCDTGNPVCGAPARPYPAGWRCDRHRPGAYRPE